MPTERVLIPRRRWFSLARLLVTIGLCALLLRVVDISRLLSVLASARWPGLSAAALVYLAAHLFYAASLRSMLAASDHRLGIGRLLANHLKGYFFNNFAPSSFGGDIYKIADLAPDVGTFTGSAAAILAQRILAMLTTMVWLLIAVPLFSPTPIGISAVVVAIAGTGFLALLLVATGGVPKRLQAGVAPQSGAARWLERWRIVHEGILTISRRNTMAAAIASILAYQGLMISGSYVLSNNLALDIGWRHFAYIVPLSVLAVALPITINGLGVREGVYVLMLGRLGATRAEALSLALLLLAFTMLFSLAGGLLYAFGRRRGGQPLGDIQQHGVPAFVHERLHAGRWVAPWLRHQNLTRYEWAAGFARGARVVEIGCGSGHGTRLLAAGQPVRIDAFDIAPSSIEQARVSHPDPRLRFLVADSARLPIDDGVADLVVCLETIEHVENDEQLVTEARRLLHPDGRFLCSTPNRVMTNPGTEITDRPFNPHHRREYSGAELVALLNRHFATVELLGQRMYGGGYARSLARVARVHPRLAVRLHQLRKLLGAPWERVELHRPVPIPAGTEPEVLVAMCAGDRTDGKGADGD